jgi:hypothetical protein
LKIIIITVLKDVFNIKLENNDAYNSTTRNFFSGRSFPSSVKLNGYNDGDNDDNDDDDDDIRKSFGSSSGKELYPVYQASSTVKCA